VTGVLEKNEDDLWLATEIIPLDPEALARRLFDSLQVSVTKAEEYVKKIAERNGHTEAGLAHIEKAQEEAANLLSELKSKGEAASKAVDQLSVIVTGASEAKGTIGEIGKNVDAIKNAVEADANRTKPLADSAEELGKRVEELEATLTALQAKSSETLHDIQSLLPGATSAGLAAAFDSRSKTFGPKQKAWERVFIVSLACLLGIALLGVFAGGGFHASDWQEIVRALVARLPLLVPVVWLALHSANQASVARKMGEEYAFKAATSIAFEGYRRQMTEVNKDATADSPLAVLCKNTLATMATPPGAVHDTKTADPTPATSLVEAAKALQPILREVTKLVEQAKR